MIKLLICSFNQKYYEKVQQFNEEKNTSIVFGFLSAFPFEIHYDKPYHQITLDADILKNNPEIVKKAHDKNMTVDVYFFNIFFIHEPEEYYYFFEIGVDVIITDYPIKVAEQLENFYSKNYLEGCLSTKKMIKIY